MVDKGHRKSMHAGCRNDVGQRPVHCEARYKGGGTGLC